MLNINNNLTVVAHIGPVRVPHVAHGPEVTHSFFFFFFADSYFVALQFIFMIISSNPAAFSSPASNIITWYQCQINNRRLPPTDSLTLRYNREQQQRYTATSPLISNLADE